MPKEMFQEKTMHLQHRVSEDEKLPVWILKILRKYEMFALQFCLAELYIGSVGAFLFQKEH